MGSWPSAMRLGRAVISLCAILPICGSVAAEEKSREMDTTLGETLKRDFGLVLRIGGGTGQSRDNPIIVLPQSDAEADQTEMQLLRGLGKGRKILWRTLSITPMSLPVLKVRAPAGAFGLGARGGGASGGSWRG